MHENAACQSGFPGLAEIRDAGRKRAKKAGKMALK
jgi:hypothetical protein